MSDIIITVENLSKRYMIHHQLNRGEGFRHVLQEKLTAPFRALLSRKEEGRGKREEGGRGTEEFWALKNVSFEVKQGEVVGIIGRNGAGKSTLLKVLSRITEPSEGRVRLRGRVASLLEVGTGFHPELTGRENIFLNGSILGMSKEEIRRKFDEIVAFSEVEKFLDTPVKRYSSGMYVRLAFAVAAHLEPEILIVDEVLAVGDAEFQKKCLGKMQNVARGGKTVMFVSHNLDSVMRLCSAAIWMDRGRLRTVGNVTEIVNSYQQRQRTSMDVLDLKAASRSSSLKDHARLIEVKSLGADGCSCWNYSFGDELAFDCTVQISKRLTVLSIAFAVFSNTGFEIASTRSNLLVEKDAMEPGFYKVAMKVKHLRLAPGVYRMNLGLRSEFGDEDFIAEGPSFEISTNGKASELFVDSIKAACIPEASALLSKLT